MARIAAVLILTALIAQSATAKFQFRKSQGKIPLKLAGANCADPDKSLPKYCCNGIVPAAEFIDTCECNPGWSHEECICKAHLAKMPCHKCMVHLPATNKWFKTFKKKELYENCETCVEKCKDEFADGQCADFMSEIYDKNFPGGDPEKVICTADYLKKQLMDENYPLELKRTLYRKPKFDADGAYHQPSDWKVAGIR
eukprot:gnl/TRDRNA2_/TRDRNA2_180008_c0_seq1.p1 gnl/TRDRNA2_/TRDRNA2_180008_c0~~gnl/TRDRNA2_/TRDRNA2_180008_c0_seq1.p1  ORF type:complete len:198 (-),score=57.05 gnl/TRDRNA2_/TRDRNA2_180008_c0_seq1:93-686(-)